VSESQLSIVVQPEAHAITLTLQGELDMGSAASFRACFDALDESFKDVVLELEELTFLDSTGIAALISLHRVLENNLGQLTLRHPQPAVARVLELTGMHDIMKIVD
jgi:anti-anti-sigma factor